MQGGGYSWHQEDHAHLSPRSAPRRTRILLAYMVHTGAKSRKIKGEVACSCLDSWARVCVCVCIVWADSHASDCTDTQT